ncbi:unnamed protein product [Pelagomonas calceolata]|uniref:Uncharacterized protein n=1 Tax=Pelagomonas calceolata TaxID=35677 RepID=A0A8J2WST7_9STRA|nr:unnamed protein product [Pelagomonas calceolata]
MTRHSLAARTTARLEIAVADIEPDRDRDQEADAAREQDRPIPTIERHADRVADHLRVAPPRAAALRALKAERLLLKVAAAEDLAVVDVAAVGADPVALPVLLGLLLRRQRRVQRLEAREVLAHGGHEGRRAACEDCEGRRSQHCQLCRGY